MRISVRKHIVGEENVFGDDFATLVSCGDADAADAADAAFIIILGVVDVLALVIDVAAETE